MPPHHHHHHHWEELPEIVDSKTKEIEEYLGGSKRDRRLSRFAFNDGPYHRRTSSAVINGALMHIAKLVSAPASSVGEDEVLSVGVEFHVPPHLRGRRNRDSASFRLPTQLLIEVFGEDEHEDIIESLIDGPPHDGAANVIAIRLLEAIYMSLTKAGSAVDE